MVYQANSTLHYFRFLSRVGICRRFAYTAILRNVAYDNLWCLKRHFEHVDKTSDMVTTTLDSGVELMSTRRRTARSKPRYCCFAHNRAMERQAKSSNLEALDRARAFAADPDATVLDLADLGFTDFPLDCITELVISGAASRIQRLDVSRNELTDLPSFLADECLNLRILFCLGCTFTTIPPVLKRCNSLFMVSFKANQLSGQLRSEYLPPNLGWLILTHNSITSLADDFGWHARGVRKLLLANNKLKTLPPNLLDSGLDESLELLRLNNNRLSEIPSCLLTKSSRLSWLGLGGNPCTLPSLSSLNELDSDLRINLSDFSVEENPSLGKGASGDVHLAVMCGAESGQKFAVKVYRERVSSDGAVADEVRAALALRNIPGLIPVQGYFYGVLSGNCHSFGIVMHAVTGMKELGRPPTFATVTRDVYPAVGTFLALPSVLRIVKQIARTATAMHAVRWCHGDLYGSFARATCAQTWKNQNVAVAKRSIFRVMTNREILHDQVTIFFTLTMATAC
jgi:hypothetical protein